MLTCPKLVNRDTYDSIRPGDWTMRDRDVRSALLQQLTAVHADDGNTRIVQEMGIWSGSVRIDIAVINAELSGFELKSDKDTLERLPYQAELYSRVFDRVALVVGQRHFEKACRLIPDWWGVIVAKQNGNAVELRPEREATRNQSIDPYLVAQLLWKDEAISVLENFDLAHGWRTKRVKAIHERLAEQLPLDELCKRVRAALKTRGEWLRQNASCRLDMPVDPNLNPMLQPLGAVRLCGN